MKLELLKEKWLDWKPKIIVLLCLVGAFISGYTAGNFGGVQPARRQLNYTPNNLNKPLEKANEKKPAPVNTQAGQGSDCPIKGSSSRIYHVRGGAFYDRTNAAVCFNTEAEAQAAGYRKSSR